MKSWFTGWRLGARVYAALFGLVAMNVSQVQEPVRTGVWENWRQPRQSTAVMRDAIIRPELQSVLAGIGQELRSLEQDPAGPDGRALPRATPDCEEDDAGCPARRAQLFRLGELLAVGLKRCGVAEASVVPTDELIVINSVLEADGRLQGLQAPLQQWMSAEAEEWVTACSAIRTLIARALGGL